MEKETIEEAAKSKAFEFSVDYKPWETDLDYREYAEYGFEKGFITGAKWQQERMYSEEDMIEFAEFVATYPDKNKNVNGQILHAKSKYDGAERTIDLLEQFKKK
jgi:hypothetical protein